MVELSPAPARVWRCLVLACGLLTVGFGATCVLGWHLHWTHVLQLRPTSAPVPYPTGLGLILLGLILVSAACGWWGWSRALARVACLFVVVAIFAITDQASFFQAMLPHYIVAPGQSPGRLAPNGVLGFGAIAASLTLASAPRFPRRREAAVVGGAVAAGLGLLALFGYASGLDSAYEWTRLNRMPVQVAAALVVLSIGVMAIALLLPASREPGVSRLRALPVGLGTLATVLFAWLGLTSLIDGRTAAAAPGASLAMFLIACTVAGLLAALVNLWIAARRSRNESRVANERLEYLATHDELTGLFNRRRFDEELVRELNRTRRDHTHMSLLMLDLDHFKDINDSLGHAAGDAVIVRVGEAIRCRLRATDTAARLGGDEFVALLPGASAVQAELVARSLLEGLHDQGDILLPEGARRVTASVGVAALDVGQLTTAQELLKRADLALYDAKESGRNRARISH